MGRDFLPDHERNVAVADLALRGPACRRRGPRARSASVSRATAPAAIVLIAALSCRRAKMGWRRSPRAAGEERGQKRSSGAFFVKNKRSTE